jgi:hypothetical protein
MLTGIFAIVGALYTWGDGIIFTVESDFLPIIVLDLFLIGPMCLMLSLAIFTQNHQMRTLKLIVVGMLITSSLMVYITEFLDGSPFDIIIILLPIMGLLLSLGLIIWESDSCIHFNTRSKIVQSQSIQ